MDSFIIKVDEKEFGPLSLAEIKGLVKKGKFAKDDLVWNDNSEEWDFAENFFDLKYSFNANNGKYQNKIYALAGGKGGVGKSVLSTSLGVSLASMGSEVILVDGDLGGPDLHTCMGILEPKFTFFDFYTLEKDTLTEIALETPIQNLRLISGACGTLGLANPKFYQKQRFIRELQKLRADYIILDLGAGSSYNVIDFFLLADEKLLVVTPEPTSIFEAFGFIKICLMRQLNRSLKDHPEALSVITKQKINRPGKIQFTVNELLHEIEQIDSGAHQICRNVLDSLQPKLILNMVKEKDDIKEGMAVQAAAMELLSLNIQYLGYISYDPGVSESVKSMKPFLLHNPKSQASQDLSTLTRVNLLGKKGFREIIEKRKWRHQVKRYSKDYPDRGLMKKEPICSVNCLYWGDCEFQDGGSKCKVRHIEPFLQES